MLALCALQQTPLLLHWLPPLCSTFVPGSVAWPPEPVLTLLALDELYCGLTGSGTGFRAWCEAAPVYCQTSLTEKPAVASYTLYCSTLLTDWFLPFSYALVPCLVCFPSKYPHALMALHLPLWWCGPQLLLVLFCFQLAVDVSPA